MIDRAKKRARRRALTLVELLITMAIISILASAVLFAMTSAQESARAAKTRSMIATLDGLLMQRYESYRTRRVPINTDGLERYQAATKRLAALRELMQLEMPERWSEVNNPTITPLLNRPTLSTFYQSRYNDNKLPDGTLSPPTPNNQQSELLYLIITLACGDGEALEHFSQSDIGDTDGDGAPEFLDGWGNPIMFIRWPAGFVGPDTVTDRQTGDARNDHDPFDPMYIQENAYRLVPLIVSSGANSEFDLIVSGGTFPTTTINTVDVLDPYAPLPEGSLGGTPKDRSTPPTPNGWHDNIHNHLLGTR